MISPRSYIYLNRQHQLHGAASTTAVSLPPSAATATSSPPGKTTSPLDKRKDDPKKAGTLSVSVAPPPRNMGKRKERRDAAATKLSPPSPPRTTTNVSTRPTTPTSPVQIPARPRRESAHHHHHHHQKKHHGQRRPQRPSDVYSPDAIPASAVALLAVTDIPRPRVQRGAQQPAKDQPLTVDAIIERQHVSEKELSLTLGKGPLDVLLRSPEELEDDDTSISDSGLGSALSTRTVSFESMPSLEDSSNGFEHTSSVESPVSPSSRHRRHRPTRPPLEPISSPPGERIVHPLSAAATPHVEIDELDFDVFRPPSEQAETFEEKDASFPFRPLRSAFKSNLTASLRALRSAARSISAINLSSIPPDDFLTRSILTIDPKVPYTDERRPPVLEEEPSAELRRYLNPTTGSRLEATQRSLSPARAFTATIQMRTYRVQRSRSAPPPSTTTARSATATAPSSRLMPHQPQPTARGQTAFEYPPGGMRQREMRENSDFIRIAVMEMAMRRRGKLDDQRPGKARWALPPRRASARAYEVGSDGVPARWVPLSE